MTPIFHIKDTIRLLYPVRVVALGLAVSQVIGTVLVYFSNRALAEKIAAIRAAGYGPLPGVNIDPPLSSFEAAFAGGAFFTLSAGAGVVLLTFGAVLLVSVLSPLYRVCKTAVLNTGWRVMALALFLPAAVAASALAAGWPILLIWANIRGFCPGMTAFLLLVPPVVIWAAFKWSPRRAGHARLPWRNPIHFALIAILLALWGSRVDGNVFADFRDNLLLTSSPGIRVVNFYYRYTLYPAEVFKRLSDKQLKTCVLEGVDDPAVADRLERVLRANDYFVVPAGGPKADLKLACRGDRLILGQGRKTRLTIDREKFMTSAGETLKQFSGQADSNAVFRRFTLVSLVGVAPLALYLATYALFCLVPGILTGIRTSSVLAPLLCFVFWAGVIMVLVTPVPAKINEEMAAAAIRDGTRQERLAALRFIHEQRLDIAGFPGYQDLLETTDFAQRYWLVRNLAGSRDPDAGMAVTRFLESDSAYIVCRAIAATAARVKKRKDMDRRHYRMLLVQKIESSDNWYVQFYAYQAARRVGWIPEKSR